MSHSLPPGMPSDWSPAPSLLRALESLLSPTKFPYGSNGPLFRDGQFGRDSLETAEDLLEIRPDIARAVILQLAALQGTVVDPKTEEEPGKIHHEHRALVMYGLPIEGESVRIFGQLARGWRLPGSEDEPLPLTQLTNYGTVDATPLFVRLVARFAATNPSILDEKYTPHRPVGGQSEPTIRASVQEAVKWITGKIEQSELGLLEWRRMTPWGHLFQAWKDGGTSYLHEDGSIGNYGSPMASIEVQGLAFDALMAAGSLLDDAPPDERTRWRALAEAIQRAVLQRFWMPDHEYFAMALDRDPSGGAVRQLRLLSSNAGALLDSGIFDTLSPGERQSYVMPIVKRLFGSEFLTPAGIRCNSLVHQNLLDYYAYQSSHTVWHKETYDIAKGLRRQGFRGLAAELERRLLNAVNLAGPREFLYVLPDNRVDYGQVETGPATEIVEIWGTNIPENDQGWTVAAALAIKWRQGRRGSARHEGSSGLASVEQELLTKAGQTRLFRTLADIETARPTGYAVHVNTLSGVERERSWVRSHPVSAR